MIIIACVLLPDENPWYYHRQLFTVMNNSPGRSRLIQADRSAPVIAPLYDEEPISFLEYARATSPVKTRRITGGSVGKTFPSFYKYEYFEVLLSSAMKLTDNACIY